MEIIVSLFAALVASSCLFAVVKSDLQARKKAARKKIKENNF